MSHDEHETLDDHRDRWSSGDLDAMRALRAQGLTVREIATRLGRTSGAVTNKLHRLKRAGQEMPKGPEELGP